MFSFFKKKKIKKQPLKFMDLNESNGELFNEMGFDSKRYGNLEKSIFYFSKAIELQPSNSEYYENRAITYWDFKKPSLALLDLEVALKLGSEKALLLQSEYRQEFDNKQNSKNNYEKLLNEVGVDYLYHMTHVDNLQRIIEYGLLSHNKAHNNALLNKDISDSTVNNRRSKLHDYVPLYFNPKNPMLYKRKDMQNQIVILCINRELLFSNNILISDGNAASSSTNFYNSIDELNKLDWNIIRSEYWNDFVDGKRIRCAETLIYEKIDITEISKIYCNNELSLNEVKKIPIDIEIPVIINKNLYF